MTSVALEKLKMSGAGRAIAVLTSGGDAQGRVSLTLFERVSCECILALFSERQCKYGSSNTS